MSESVFPWELLGFFEKLLVFSHGGRRIYEREREGGSVSVSVPVLHRSVRKYIYSKKTKEKEGMEGRAIAS